jgi:hypothetical protein
MTTAYIVVSFVGNISLMYFGFYFFWMGGLKMVKPNNINDTRRRKSGSYSSVLDDLQRPEIHHTVLEIGSENEQFDPNPLSDLGMVFLMTDF